MAETKRLLGRDGKICTAKKGTVITGDGTTALTDGYYVATNILATDSGLPTGLPLYYIFKGSSTIKPATGEKVIPLTFTEMGDAQSSTLEFKSDEIDVTTLGGVIPQNGKLMTIVPLEDKLLIEAHISPRDIAFIRPGQEALVKITAYDYSIYGGLTGKVTVISPDTIRDEVKQDQFYYRVYIRTDSDKLFNKAGQAFGITPGMVATVDGTNNKFTAVSFSAKYRDWETDRKSVV